jgi:hypothetical protein
MVEKEGCGKEEKEEKQVWVFIPGPSFQALALYSQHRLENGKIADSIGSQEPEKEMWPGQTEPPRGRDWRPDWLLAVSLFTAVQGSIWTIQVNKQAHSFQCYSDSQPFYRSLSRSHQMLVVGSNGAKSRNESLRIPGGNSNTRDFMRLITSPFGMAASGYDSGPGPLRE